MSVVTRDLLIAVANLATALLVLAAVLSGVPLSEGQDIIAVVEQ